MLGPSRLVTFARGRGFATDLDLGRARAARALGRTLLHSDATASSCPILQRSGLLAVATTTPDDR